MASGQRIAVLASGAIGSSVAGDLIESGHDVTLIDQWPQHVEAMKRDGLRVSMSDHQFTVPVQALHLCELASARRQFDIVLLACKGQETRWFCELIAPYLAADGVMVGLQNGMNDAAIASIVGRERVIGCVVELSAEVFTPGQVQRNTTRSTTWFAFGELDGRFTPRLRAIEAMMRHCARVTLTANIEGAKWTKLVNSSMILAPFGVLGLQSWQAVQIPEVVSFCVRLARETLAVGAAAGYRIEPIFGLTYDEFAGSTDEVIDKLLHTILGHLGANAKKARGVVLQDLLKGRVTETDYLSGQVVRQGRDLGVPAPANAAVVELARRIHLGELKPDRANIEWLRARADAGTS